MRLFAKVSYNGSKYQGWQKQVNAPTIQETIETVLSKLLNTQINIFGSGRTDAGVHAKEQTFHFDVEKLNMEIPKLLYATNCLLPEDIKLLSLEEVDPSFHARFSIASKIYEYHIRFDNRDVFLNDFEFATPIPTDIDLFIKALKLFEGQHNFQNFTSKEEDEDGYVRTIYSIDVERNDKSLTIFLKGDGFMRYMIRMIVGTALAVAQQKEDINYISELLKEGNKRHVCAYKAPAKGLFLSKVIYK